MAAIVNHQADADTGAPRGSGWGIHILCILAVFVPATIFLYPIIVFFSDPFGGIDEPAVMDPSHGFSQLTGWSLPTSATIVENTNSHSGLRNEGDYVLVVRMPCEELQSLLESDQNTWLDCPLAPEIASSARTMPVHSGTKYFGKKSSESDNDWDRGHVVVVNPETGMVWIYEWKN
jgi:hypothetical protein